VQGDEAMKLSEIKQVLTQKNLQLTKSLGQNFLHDGNQLRRIVAAAELTPSDKVLEIGPGLGPLTELLLQQAGEVLAIEKDARLVEVLRQRLEAGANPKSNLRLLHADALDYLRQPRMDWSTWKLVANLPYSVASPLLVELSTGERSPSRIVATLQLEVARRLMAGPGSPDYGLLSLLVQIDFEPRDSFKIPAGCFYPEPDVQSACVILVKRQSPLLPQAQRTAFMRIVKRGFSQRRKMMLKLLKQDWSPEALTHAFERVNVATTARAESLKLEQFVELTRVLTEEGTPLEDPTTPAR